MKNKNLYAVLSLTLFLVAQALGVAHAAEYGLAKHKHYGQVCDIYLSSEQAKCAPPPPPVVLHICSCVSVTFFAPKSLFLHGEAHSSAFPRAPPGTLLF